MRRRRARACEDTVNKAFFIGNLTRDPELRETQDGTKVCSFTLAMNRPGRGEHPETDYVRVTAWRTLGERCAQYLAKGKKACAVGAVRAAAYIGNDGAPRANLELQAESVEFLSPKSQAAQQGAPEGYTSVPDEDLPEFR